MKIKRKLPEKEAKHAKHSSDAIEFLCSSRDGTKLNPMMRKIFDIFRIASAPTFFNSKFLAG